MDKSRNQVTSDLKAKRPVWYRFGKMILILIALIAGIVVWFRWEYPAGILRYRMTVEVQVGDELRTGSGVIEARYHHNPGWLPGHPVGSRARGEAVTIDLGARGVLFLLLTDSGSGSDAQNIPKRIFNIETWKASVIRDLSDFEAKAEIPFEDLPMLVQFRNITDPKTVELVEPDDLAASFGPGVRLKRVIIETTKDPVTTGIEKRLRWLGRLKGGYLDGAFAGGGPALSNILHGGNFEIGVN